MALGECALIESRYEDAAASFARAAQTNAQFSTAYLFQGVALALAGSVAEGRAIAHRGLELEPRFSPRQFEELGLVPVLIEKLLEGLRRIGISE
jgi:hypothetical protein